MGEGTGTTTDGVTVVVQVAPAPPSAERVDDLLTLFGLFVVALIVVWGAKQLLNLFTVNHHDEA